MESPLIWVKLLKNLKRLMAGKSRVSYFLSEFDKIIEIARKPDRARVCSKDISSIQS